MNTLLKTLSDTVTNAGFNLIIVGHAGNKCNSDIGQNEPGLEFKKANKCGSTPKQHVICSMLFQESVSKTV